MHRSYWCPDPTDAPILLMRQSCWCADPADVLILLMGWYCWYCLCTEPADTLILLIYWCCWCSNATESGSGFARGNFYSNLLQFQDSFPCFCSASVVLTLECCFNAGAGSSKLWQKQYPADGELTESWWWKADEELMSWWFAVERPMTCWWRADGELMKSCRWH